LDESTEEFPQGMDMQIQPISNVYMTVDDQLVSLTPTSPVKRTPKGQRNKNPRNNPSTTQITSLTQQNFTRAMYEKYAQNPEKLNWTIRDDDKLI
jgi:hypothetical protein